MGAIAGVILLVIAAFLKATAGNPSIMIWLIIVGAILIGAEVAWGWNRGGRTYRTRRGV
jgi:membrane-bound ClpP family serine protease